MCLERRRSAGHLLQKSITCFYLKFHLLSFLQIGTMYEIQITTSKSLNLHPLSCNIKQMIHTFFHQPTFFWNVGIVSTNVSGLLLLYIHDEFADEWIWIMICSLWFDTPLGSQDLLQYRWKQPQICYTKWLVTYKCSMQLLIYQLLNFLL